MEQCKISGTESTSSSHIVIADIIEETTVDGSGLRTAIYVAGCPIKCAKCHNKQYWSIKSGKPMDIDTIVSKVLEDEFISGVSILGGEPFAQVDALAELLHKLKEHNINIWVYTGYTLEHLSVYDKARECLELIDTLVDGPYIEELHDPTLQFRGSSNQRIIHKPYERQELLDN